MVNLIISFLAAIFLADPLLNFSHTYFSATDLLQGSPVFRLNSWSGPAHNSVLGDDIYTYLPWIDFAWRSLRQGVLPLWNPYNGAGQPLLANMQSSILFPSQWSGFFFGERVGLVARCFLHLYLAGIFAYYYFRALKVGAGAALVGAVAFMFSGMLVVWLYNELSATFLLFPLILWVLERRLNRLSSGLRFAGEFGGVVALQIFGGHPETIFLSMLLATLYLVFRLATEPILWKGWKTKFGFIGTYIAGGCLGIGLGAIQLLPFLEYLFNSTALVRRSATKVYSLLAPQYLLSFILPNPFGNPIFGPKLDFTRPNYSEVSGSFIGMSVVFLAVGALWVARRNRLVWFLWFLVALIVQIVYGIGPLPDLFARFQPVDIMYNRLTGYAGFFLITLMVLTVDGLFKTKKGPKTRFDAPFWLVIGAGTVFLFSMLGLFWWFSNSKLMPFDRAKVNDFEVRDFLGAITLFLVSLAGVILLLQGSRLKLAGICLLTLAIFGQLSLTGSHYRAAIPDALFFPTTPLTTALQNGGGRVAQAGTTGLLPPETNIWYNIEQVSSYDSLGVRWFDRLRQASLNRWPGWNNAVPLNLFNIKQVLAPNGDPQFQTGVVAGCPQLQRVGKFYGANLFNNTNYQPPYRLEYKAVISASEAQATSDLLDARVNPLDTVVFLKGDSPADLTNNPAPVETPPVKVITRTATAVKLQVKNPQAGYLYIDQTYFPGWEAVVNGEQGQQLYRANVAFTVLPVKAGDLTIELKYNPVSFRVGLGLSVLSVLILSFMAMLRQARRRHRANKN